MAETRFLGLGEIASDVILMVELCDRSLDLAVVGYFEGRSTVCLGELGQELGRSRSVLQLPGLTT